MSIVPFSAGGALTPAPVQPTLSSSCEAALKKIAALLPDGVEDCDVDRMCELLVHTASAGAEYLLVTKGTRACLLLMGDPSAEQILADIVRKDVEAMDLLHVRLRTGGVTVTGVDLLRAQQLVALQWGFDLHTVRHRAALTRPMHVVRRCGHAVGTAVLFKDGQALRGQLWVSPGLTSLDQVRTWFSLIEAAAAELGRRPTIGDDVTVNGTSFMAWLADRAG